MIFLSENQTMYLTSWEYNSTLIINKLAEKITAAGGSVKKQTAGYIVNRALFDKIEAKKADIIRVENFISKVKAGEIAVNSDAGSAALETYKKELAALEAIDNLPVNVNYLNWITFTLDGVYYYLSLDENPFFNFHYIKTPIKNGFYSLDACADNFNKNWLFDCFLYANCDPAEIENAANCIFAGLIAAKNSIIRRDYTRRRVNNSYNSGYHYENIYAKERTKQIDF